ncbi:hypothetical protein DPMN_053078 [Dreissena polymorpha]|uniref:Uncharacterized protein n=1 Tax=Dreissena polymorpha TaxID=45954 RepID=A0A9D4HNI2_DREPO|nr:hypothetical protein DPMN_053078 [Dreissena polymorpha]
MKSPCLRNQTVSQSTKMCHQCKRVWWNQQTFRQTSSHMCNNLRLMDKVNS